MIRTIVAFAALMLLAAAPLDRSMQALSDDPVVTTGGRVAGTRLASGVKAYLGVPYAAPPLEQLRWAPPQPIAWQGVWNADRKPPQCMQVMRPHDINHYFGLEVMSEDCLYLNIWAPERAARGDKLPVIVFIHGGGFTIGTSGMAIYEGETVARAGAIFISMNYRVGALGFLAHPELSAAQGGHSGNYGLMDQQAALAWVQKNIPAFGGDPDHVLISGQSAGAGSVIAHLFSPPAKGLFSAAMMSSGCTYRSEPASLDVAEKTGLAFQARLKAADLAAMRNVPADQIIAAQTENQLGLRVAGVRIQGPIIDGDILPDTRAAMIAAGRLNAVPIMAGYTSHDLSFGFEPLLAATTIADFRAAAEKLYGADAAAFLTLYPAKKDADIPALARRAATQAGLENNARHCAQVQAALGKPAYIYEYTRVHPYAPGVQIADQNPATIGAYHTADIPYWFGTQDAFNLLRPTRQWTAWDRALSARMTAALIAFARTGDPATAQLAWPAWQAKAETKITFGDEISITTMNRKRADWLAAHPPAAAPPSPRPGAPRD